MNRFFVHPDQIEGDIVTLDRDDALHLDRVLRAGIGDEIGAIDGSGRMAVARLTALTKSSASATILRFEALGSEPNVNVTVAQALPKTAEKLEWVLQHGVETGATRFVVFRGRRSEAGKLAVNPERWAKIVKSAAEQSGRALLPPVEFAPSLRDALDLGRAADITLFCDEAEQACSLRRTLANQTGGSVFLIVGPEGGWADEERKAASESGAVPITLGPRILRTETAALVALSQILYALDAEPGPAGRQL